VPRAGAGASAAGFVATLPIREVVLRGSDGGGEVDTEVDCSPAAVAAAALDDSAESTPSCRSDAKAAADDEEERAALAEAARLAAGERRLDAGAAASSASSTSTSASKSTSQSTSKSASTSASTSTSLNPDAVESRAALYDALSAAGAALEANGGKSVAKSSAVVAAAVEFVRARATLLSRDVAVARATASSSPSQKEEASEMQAGQACVAALLLDLEGECTLAFSDVAKATRWGKHYARSLAFAHRTQTCNNFKDPGVQGCVRCCRWGRCRRRWRWHRRRLPSLALPLAWRSVAVGSTTLCRCLSREGWIIVCCGLVTELGSAPTRIAIVRFTSSSLYLLVVVSAAAAAAAAIHPSIHSSIHPSIHPSSYGGALFAAVRDTADDVFLALPPPTASRRKQLAEALARAKSGGAGRRAFAKTVPQVNMAQYYNFSGGCIAGDCLALLADGSTRRVDQLRRGDLVVASSSSFCDSTSASATATAAADVAPDAVAAAGGGIVVHGVARVRCVVETAVTSPDGRLEMAVLAGGALKITPWHPVRRCAGEGAAAWQFPNDAVAGRTTVVQCPAVFTFVLEEAVISGDGISGVGVDDRLAGGGAAAARPCGLVVGGMECASLGHGATHDPVLAHEFLGTQRVVDALQACRGWDDGRVRLRQGDFVRDPATNRVVGVSQSV
jgi:hypothetical protein